MVIINRKMENKAENKEEKKEERKESKPSLIKRISRKFSLTPKPKLSEEDIQTLVSRGENDSSLK